MRRYVRVIGWPVRKRTLYDSETATLVFESVRHAWLPDPSTWWLTLVNGHVRQSLFRTPGGRYFKVVDHRFSARLKPLWKWQARLWLLRRRAPAEIVRREFPKAFKEA